MSDSNIPQSGHRLPRRRISPPSSSSEHSEVGRAPIASNADEKGRMPVANLDGQMPTEKGATLLNESGEGKSMNAELSGPDMPKSSPAGDGPAADLSAWLDGYRGVLETWVQSRIDVMNGAADLFREVAAFSQSRIQAQMDAWNALTLCRNASEVLECQRQFAEKAASQHFDEAGKIATNIVSLLASASVPFRKQPTRLSRSEMTVGLSRPSPPPASSSSGKEADISMLLKADILT